MCWRQSLAILLRSSVGCSQASALTIDPGEKTASVLMTVFVGKATAEAWTSKFRKSFADEEASAERRLIYGKALAQFMTHGVLEAWQ